MKSSNTTKYELLIKLINLLDNFEEDRKDEVGNNLDTFLDWILLRKKEDRLSQLPVIKQPKPKSEENAQVTQLLFLMNTYIKFYFKKGMADQPLLTVNDFGFLATLVTEGSATKKELIEMNVMEFTSGIEVIKRLEKKGLVESYPDPNDKRARRVKATEDGRYLFLQVLPTLSKIGDLAIGNLSQEEINILLHLLNKLNKFHHPIFHHSKEASLEEITENYSV